MRTVLVTGASSGRCGDRRPAAGVGGAGLSGGTEFSVVRFHADWDRAAAVYADTQALSADDVAEAVHWAASVPPHVNVHLIELMPVAQSFAGFQIARSQ